MRPTLRLLLGTNNRGKLQEMSSLLDGLPLILVTPSDLRLNTQIEETGNSYQENAALKAMNWSIRSGLACLADDTGLEVDALDGAPGLFSHRFTGDPNASDAERRRYLIDQLREFPHPWTARFKCAVAIAIPGLKLISAMGSCEGEIIVDERGTNGFGYDPVFLVKGSEKTMAELSLEEKNIISHRARAIQSIRASLVKRLHGQSYLP